ncbi:MAG: alpha/beta hydrolase [Woeseiaceae bacterium]|nr:alpha/beta hydrolase [Woeseiaceae bacterium]
MKRILTYLVIVVAALVGLMALFPEQTAKLGISAERAMSSLAYRTIVVGDETWHYLEGGPNDADVVLLIHGFGGDKDNWTRFSKSLTGAYRVIAPDLPGFGESARHPDWDYSLPPQRERVNGFVAALGLEEFHLIGHSMGGHLAALYTHKYPEQVLSLALFNNAGVDVPDESDMWRALADGHNPLIVESPEDFDRLLAFASHKRPFVPWPLKGVMARQAMNNGAFNQTVFASLMSDTASNLEPVLPDIGAPALILWGEYDRITDVSSIDVMRPLLPNTEVVIMKDTGHLPMLERPAETAGHYLGFLESG